MKIKFFYNIGLGNVSREEIFDYPEGTPDEEIQEDFDAWSSNFVDGGFYEVGDE